MTTTDNHVTREQFRALEVYVVNQLPTREHLAELRTEVLVVRNLCNDGLIGTGPFPGHTGLMETIAEQSGFHPSFQGCWSTSSPSVLD